MFYIDYLDTWYHLFHIMYILQGLRSEQVLRESLNVSQYGPMRIAKTTLTVILENVSHSCEI